MATSNGKKKKATKARKAGGNKVLRIGGGIVLAIALIAAWWLFAPNTGSLSSGEYLFIHTGSNYDAVREALKEGGFVRDGNGFDLLARQAGYPKNVHPGRYHITKGMSNWSIVRLLRSGRQTPVRLVVGKLRTKEDLIRLIGRNLEADSNTLRRMLNDSVYLGQFGLNPATAICAVIPNSYDFYWNTSADKAFRKLELAYLRYWNTERREKAEKMGLTPAQAVTLASIVEEESNHHDEQPKIASVYLNRIKKSMKLQADPTARFAGGDFTIKRVTAKQTGLNSPYNTYVYLGLPPGPICTPSLRTLNATLDAPETPYLFFCAKEDFSGYHNFASNWNEHRENARRYQQALDARGIR
jgi:UPF0755 protein